MSLLNRRILMMNNMEDEDMSEWRLLKTVSVTEKTNKIVIDKDEDGNSFSVKDLFIYSPLDVIASSNSQMLIKFNNNYAYMTTANGFVGTDAKSVFVKSEWVGTRTCLSGSSSYSVDAVALAPSGFRVVNGDEYIEKLTFELQSNITFNAGTFYIFGK